MFIDRWYRRRDLRLAIANWILPDDCLALRKDHAKTYGLSQREKVCYRETIRRLERALAKAKTRLAISSACVKVLMDTIRRDEDCE